MKKIAVFLPKKRSKKLAKILKDKKVNKYERIKTKNGYKYEIVATELQTSDLIKTISNELEIYRGKPTEEGYIVVMPVEIVAPYIYDKGSTVELKELLLTDVKDFVKLDTNYMLFIIGAAILTGLSFALDNLYILIGAMIVGPLMTPIMATSYGLMERNRTIIKKGLINELVGTFLIILTVSLMAFFPNQSLAFERSLASGNIILSLVLASVIGVIASNSFLTGKFEAQTGVAISISLIPPLANFVVLFFAGYLSGALNSLITFLVNVLGMHISSYFSFLAVYTNEQRKK